MPPLKILITGAGIAGTALAFWLAKLGHDVTVLERFPTLRTTGLQIDLRGHGVEVLKRMGLEEGFRAKSVNELGLQVVDKSGRRRAFFPANRTGKGEQSFTSEFEIMRGDLCRLLHDAAVAEGAKFVFGTRVENFVDGEGDGDALRVALSNGETRNCDLLVGADGQWSHTRSLMLGTSVEDGFYRLKDVYIGYFTTPRPADKGEGFFATMYQAPGHRGVMTRRSNSDELQVYLGCVTPSERLEKIRRGDIIAEKAALTDIMRGAGWQVDELLEAMQEAENFYCERLGLVKLESWSRGRVALLGDAAYCPSANTGMGTTSAIVGAYMLAGEIAEHCGRAVGAAKQNQDGKKQLVAALKAYEQNFRPFMTQVQERVLEEPAEASLPSSAFGIGVMNLILGAASLFKVNIFAWFLKEKVKNWDLPAYEALRAD